MPVSLSRDGGGGCPSAHNHPTSPRPTPVRGRRGSSGPCTIVVVMRVAVLASGSGTILDATLTAGIPVEVVVEDRPCGATAVADRHGVAWELVERSSFGAGFDRAAYTDQVLKVLKAHDTDLVMMAGFGTILAP